MTFTFKTVYGGTDVLCCNFIAQWLNIKVQLLHRKKVTHTHRGCKDQHQHRHTYITGVVHLVNSILPLEVLFRKDPVHMQNTQQLKKSAVNKQKGQHTHSICIKSSISNSYHNSQGTHCQN